MKSFQKVLLLIIFLSVAVFSAIEAKRFGRLTKLADPTATLSNEPTGVPSHSSIFSKELTVSCSSTGDFTSVQAAIDNGVPENNTQWIHIYVTAGTYSEQVTVPANKPYIFLEGDSKKETTIQSGGNPDIFNATIIVKADNFAAKSVVFKNTYNLGRAVYNLSLLDSNNVRLPAVAALVGGDKVAFYECSFLGVQDTLFDAAGRHYFFKCYIEGYVDFIFGSGQSVYEDSTIMVSDRGGSGGGGVGYITAQRRNSGDDPNGFVFKSCNVTGSVGAYLGRAWGPYSRVLYYKTSLSNIITPAGWDAWTFKGHEENLVYAEGGCSGWGSNRSKRVSWEKRLSPIEWEEFVGQNFINSDHWIQKLPIWNIPEPRL